MLIVFAHSFMHLTNAATRINDRAQRQAAGPKCPICARCVSTTDAKIYLTTATSLARARSQRDVQPRAISDCPSVPIRDHFLLSQATVSLCPTCRVRCARDPRSDNAAVRRVYLTTSTSLARARSRRDVQLRAIADRPGVPIRDHFLLSQATVSLCPTCRVRCAPINVATTPRCVEPDALIPVLGPAGSLANVTHVTPATPTDLAPPTPE
jgi:hypothetical protein